MIGGESAALGSSWVSWVFPVVMPLIIIVVVLLLRAWGSANRPMPSGSDETALEILQKRFAHGEITRDQYGEMVALLQRDAGRSPGRPGSTSAEHRSGSTVRSKAPGPRMIDRRVEIDGWEYQR